MEGSLTRHHARVVWEREERDRRAHRIEIGAELLLASCSEHWGGDEERADPEEMFVAALSSCHMLWFLALARERRLRVRSYEDEPVGELDGTRITRVSLRPEVDFEHDPGEEVLAELHREAHERCYIANSVSCSVEVEMP